MMRSLAMSMPGRRPSGVVLATLLAFQSIAMPAGVCARGHGAQHQSGESAHPASSGEVIHELGSDMAQGGLASEAGSDEHHGSASHQPDASQTDCLVLSGCGAAVGTLIQTVALCVALPERFDMSGSVPSHPMAVDLGISTPPPKI
jgi:hypothetical protein